MKSALGLIGIFAALFFGYLWGNQREGLNLVKEDNFKFVASIPLSSPSSAEEISAGLGAAGAESQKQAPAPPAKSSPKKSAVKKSKAEEKTPTTAPSAAVSPPPASPPVTKVISPPTPTPPPSSVSPSLPPPEPDPPQSPPPPSSSPQPEPAPPQPPPPPSPPEPPPSPPPTPPAGNVNHVVISEIQLTGGTGKTTNDFIELYNPTGASVDLSGWKLRKRTQSGNESSIRVFEDGKTIPTHGFFLWANSSDGFAASIGADESSTASIAANNSIGLFDNDGSMVDAVGWGADLQNPFAEGSPLTAVLDANQSFERKAWNGGCISASGSGESLGNGCDADSNQADFEVRGASLPQYSRAAVEP